MVQEEALVQEEEEETEEVASCLDAYEEEVAAVEVPQAALPLPPLLSSHVMAAAVEAASPCLSLRVSPSTAEIQPNFC